MIEKGDECREPVKKSKEDSPTTAEENVGLTQQQRSESTQHLQHPQHFVFLLQKRMADVLVPFINCLLVLDSDGDRIIAKYYTGKSKPDQLKFENALHKKTKTMTLRSDGMR
jgi:hypothetical protein